MHRHVMPLDASVAYCCTAMTFTVITMSRVPPLALLLVALLVSCDRGNTSAAVATIDWQTSPLDLNLRGMNGSSYLFRCPSGKPAPALVTGSSVYTDASSICAAAVHAGAIDSQRGGVVRIQILPGQAAYTGSTRNFLRSQDYARSWGGSFAVLSTANSPAEESQ